MATCFLDFLSFELLKISKKNMKYYCESVLKSIPTKWNHYLKIAKISKNAKNHMHHKVCNISFGPTVADLMHLYIKRKHDNKQKELKKLLRGYHQIKFNAVKSLPFL